MPRIRFILVRCSHCGTECKVRLERIERREPFECLTCGDMVEVARYIPILEMLYHYSEIVLKVEDQGRVDGDVLVPSGEVQRASSLY
ncbi:MAG: hypothetical protein M1358_00775 [Chloroflexi bacterium]|nr:hypothetical protein [Chloroflexota bacterium]